MASTFAEASLYCAAAAGAGLLWNWLSPAGIRLDQSYSLPAPAAAAPGAAAEDAVTAYAREYGLQLIDLADAREYAKYATDPSQGIIFLDARDAVHYGEGHIAGAICVDPYHMDDSLTPELLERLRQASQIVVYCAGGQCEDSVLLSRNLVYGPAQVPPEVLMIYRGGINEWREQGLPVER